MNYDKFQVGDKVWSEAYGFGHIFNTQHEFADACFDSKNGNWRNLEILHSGQLHFFHDRPRTFFHAVADTDEGMREAIARGKGLKRPVPRGRWPIEPGDRVLAFCESLEVKVGILTENEYSRYNVKLGGTAFWKEGLFLKDNPIPRAMRLYDGEEPFEDPCENMRWMMDEAIKFGWHEKYGKS